MHCKTGCKAARRSRGGARSRSRSSVATRSISNRNIASFRISPNAFRINTYVFSNGNKIGFFGISRPWPAASLLHPPQCPRMNRMSLFANLRAALAASLRRRADDWGREDDQGREDAAHAELGIRPQAIGCRTRVGRKDASAHASEISRTRLRFHHDFRLSDSPPVYRSRSRRWRRARLGFPGQPPYTRGIHASMYRGSCGRCGSSRDSARPKTPTRASAICFRKGRPGFPSRSICRR